MKVKTLFLLVILGLFACKKQEDTVILSGKIENLKADSVYILNSDQQKVVSIPLSKNGEFNDTLKLDKGFYYLEAGREYTQFYLKPGYKLNISVDENNFDETIKYTGEGADENNLLANKLLFEQNLGQKNYYGFYGKLNETDFLKLADSISNAEINLVKKENLKDKDFVKGLIKSINFNKFYKISQYEAIHKYVTKDTAFKVSANFPNAYDSVDINDIEMLTVPGYKTFVTDYYRSELSDSEQEDFSALMKKIDKECKNDSLKDILIYNIGKSDINYTKDLDNFYKTFKSLIKDQQYLDEVTKEFNLLKKIAPGEKSPDFSFENVDGKKISLKDFRGKIVYIDIWAVWCHPCVGEIPFLEKLKKEFKGKDIVFISIDLGDNIDRWKAFIKAKNMTALQLRAQTGKEEFFNQYQVVSIPRFIIIGRDGTILDNNSIRPSNPNIVNYLNSFLNK